MPILSIPNTFLPNTLAQSGLVDANFNAVAAIVNGLDYLNVGAAGFQAAQIIPTNTAQATFGGTVGYTFNPGLTTVVPLSISAPNGMTADLLDLYVNGVKLVAFLSSGILQFNSVRTGIQLGASIGSGIQLKTGAIWDILNGAHYNGTNWVANATNASIIEFNTALAAISFYVDSGLTVNGTYTPTLLCSFNPLQVVMGAAAKFSWLSGQANVGAGPYGPYLAQGAYYNGTNWVATAGTATTIAIGVSGDIFISYNTGLTPGNTFTPNPTIETTLTGAGSNNLSLLLTGGVSPGNNSNNGSLLWSGTGVPSNSLGSNGDFYFRQDNVGGTTNIYKKASGSWNALL